MKDHTRETIIYDIRGQICPSSLLTTLKELNAMKTRLQDGSVQVTVLTDNRDAIITIPETATNMGYEVVVAKEKDYYSIDVYKQVTRNQR